MTFWNWWALSDIPTNEVSLVDSISKAPVVKTYSFSWLLAENNGAPQPLIFGANWLCLALLGMFLPDTLTSFLFLFRTLFFHWCGLTSDFLASPSNGGGNMDVFLPWSEAFGGMGSFSHWSEALPPPPCQNRIFLVCLHFAPLPLQNLASCLLPPPPPAILKCWCHHFYLQDISEVENESNRKMFSMLSHRNIRTQRFFF